MHTCPHCGQPLTPKERAALTALARGRWWRAAAPVCGACQQTLLDEFLQCLDGLLRPHPELPGALEPAQEAAVQRLLRDL